MQFSIPCCAGRAFSPPPAKRQVLLSAGGCGQSVGGEASLGEGPGSGKLSAQEHSHCKMGQSQEAHESKSLPAAEARGQFSHEGAQKPSGITSPLGWYHLNPRESEVCSSHGAGGFDVF